MGKVRVLLRGRSARHPAGAAADPAAGGVDAGPTAGAMCQAPFGSIFLMPTGDVRACSESFGHDLGNITQQRLPEIWHGARLAALREAALRRDYSLGCHKCGQITAAGVPAPSRYFDNLATDTLEPEYPKKLILSLSNSCNLRCIQCDGDLSSSIRIAEGRPRLPDVYDEQFFADLDEFLPHAEAVHFLGGEPFLVTAYQRIWDRLAVVNPEVECYVSTNATQWNSRVERVLSQLRFNVEMSIDGFSKETLEQIRVGADHASVMANVERFVEYAASAARRRRSTTA